MRKGILFFFDCIVFSLIATWAIGFFGYHDDVTSDINVLLAFALIFLSIKAELKKNK